MAVSVVLKLYPMVGFSFLLVIVSPWRFAGGQAGAVATIESHAVKYFAILYKALSDFIFWKKFVGFASIEGNVCMGIHTL